MKDVHPPYHCPRRPIRGSFFLIGLLMLWAGSAFAQTPSQETDLKTQPTESSQKAATPAQTVVAPSPTPLPPSTPTPTPTATPVPAPTPLAGVVPACGNTITAKVVAFDQIYTYNRFGAFNPAGMMYALARDVVGSTPGGVSLRADKRPRPIVLRVNEGDCLSINFTNYLSSTRLSPSGTENSDTTKTRYASIHVNGLDYLNIASDGANVGRNVSSLVAPGSSATYSFYAKKQGQYLMYSMAAPAGGEGDNGQPGLGLFGSINVEPKNSKWYRSQVTAAQLQAATVRQSEKGTPIINYDTVDTASGLPVLNMLNGTEIVHTDLNAIITGANGAALDEDCTKAPPTGTCGEPFREFTAIFHDEIKAVQAFPELDAEMFHGVRDGFAINYGASSLGSALVANRKKVGPSKNCDECKFEEFFLESSVNGDPAMVLRRNKLGVATALYPDDPSNVHHSYLGDPVRFRNLHTGAETHVFHLHAHQWLESPRDENSTYLDSQTIGPGGSFTYEINYGGSGNRNLNPGDSIFHCHLYPHFAQGMWELWRNHDAFEAGTPDRNLPDAEIAGGTPNPAIVPIPGKALAPMPAANFKGFPFYIMSEAAVAGHRPPQPPLDFALDAANQPIDGGLPRHISVGSPVVLNGEPAIDANLLNDPVAANVLSQIGNARRAEVLQFARKEVQSKLVLIKPEGTTDEQNAMKFHEGTATVNGMTGFQDVRDFTAPVEDWQGAAYWSVNAAGAPAKFYVNGHDRQPGAPYADPCRRKPAFVRQYRAAYIQFDMTVNRAKWHDRQARITVLEEDVNPTLSGSRSPEPFFFRANSGDCIQYSATNLMPEVLNLDDFQIFTPTDIVGQHIHLVKFDVTSSDGAGNGWNYEDGTFAPGEVRERIAANNAYQTAINGTQFLTAKTHPRLGVGPNREWLGAQTTVQRWWADPLVNTLGQDRTIRTVFTHDHFGPSSHQHHGLYGALVVEPADSTWNALNNTTLLGGQATQVRADGGPTSFAANIATNPTAKSFREFNLAFADYALVYTKDLVPVNPPGREDTALPIAIQPTVPMPETISSHDPGTQLVNYRNEPIPLRIGQYNGRSFVQRSGNAGDLAYVFSSFTHNDPFTPILTAYEGDRTMVRLIQGAQEEQHVFTAHGVKWLFEPSAANSGYRNAQQIGISEHFEMELAPLPTVNNNPYSYSTAYTDKGQNFVDHLYASAGTDNLWDGQWGILRIYQGTQPGPVRVPVPSNQGLDYRPSSGATAMRAGDGATSSFGTTDAATDSRVAAGEMSPDAATLNTSNPDGYDKLGALPNNPTGRAGSVATTTTKSDPLYSPAAPDSTGTGTTTDSASTATTANADGTAMKTAASSTLVIDPMFSSGTARKQTVAASVCPAGAPARTYTVGAYMASNIVPGGALTYSQRFGIKDSKAIIFVENSDVASIQSGARRPEPLILRAAAGDCISVTLTNNLPTVVPEINSWNEMPMIVNYFNFNQVKTSNRVSLHPQLVSANTFKDDASAVGYNDDSTVGPGQTRTYTWYAGNRVVDAAGNFVQAPVEFGATGLRDMGDVIKHSSHGAIGSLIIEPVGAQWSFPVANSKATADVASGTGTFREFVAIYQDDLTVQQNGVPLENIAQADDSEDTGMKGFNYRTEPLWGRLGFPVTADTTTTNNFDYKDALSSTASLAGCGGVCGDPETPVFTATAGVPVRFRVLSVSGHPRQHSFALFGHHWNFEPFTQLSTVQGFNPFTYEVGAYDGIGPMRHTNILTLAGGLRRVAGDYLFRTMDSPNFSGGGLWGIFRVTNAKTSRIEPPPPQPPVYAEPQTTDAAPRENQ